MAEQTVDRADLKVLLLLLAASLATACVTPAEFEKVRVKVVKLDRAQAATPAGQQRQRMADLANEIERLSKQLESLHGRVEVTEHQARSALAEARAARVEAAKSKLVVPVEEPEVPEPEGVGSDELEGYRAAYAAWRGSDYASCIDRFRNFLQDYPDSAYADDGAYWMADCYFKQGDYKTAVLRFDDVVARYPTGNKAADALFRQGEALLRLGPN